MVRQFVYFTRAKFCTAAFTQITCITKSNRSGPAYIGFTYFVIDDEVRAAVQALLVDEGRNTEGSACTNCGTPSSMEICFECLLRQQCKKCRRYLPDHLFVTHTLCRACNKKQNKPRPTIKNALNETATEIEILSAPHFMDYPSLIIRYTQSITEHVDDYVQRHGSILVGITSHTTFTRDLDGHFSRIPAYFHVLPQIVNAAQPFDLGFVSENLDSQVDYFTTRGSGFTLEAIHRFVLCITPYRPPVGSSYIPTPAFLVGKQCLVNI